MWQRESNLGEHYSSVVSVFLSGISRDNDGRTKHDDMYAYLARCFQTFTSALPTSLETINMRLERKKSLGVP